MCASSVHVAVNVFCPCPETAFAKIFRTLPCRVLHLFCSIKTCSGCNLHTEHRGFFRSSYSFSAAAPSPWRAPWEADDVTTTDKRFAGLTAA